MRSEGEVRAVRRALLAWYREHARDLPWRRTRDPYAIWISEVLLQQTRVETVVPYFERFMREWPNVRALATADPSDVRAAWSGLGYYRRAESMLRAAAILAKRPDASLPSEPEALAQLPGFGPYTTGAVASIAFDRPVPAVDGNVTRVLARLYGLSGSVTEGSGARRVWDLAGRLVLGDTPGDLNQALIELGAVVCKRKPTCSICPVRNSCEAYALGAQDRIPPPRKRPDKRPKKMTSVVLWSPGFAALTRQPARGLFAGMYCPPLFEGELSADQACARLETEWGVRVKTLEARAAVEHVLTHRRIEATVWAGISTGDPPLGWVNAALAELDNYGLPSFAAKLLRSAIPPKHLPSRLPGRRRGRPEQISLRLEDEVGPPVQRHARKRSVLDASKGKQ